MIVVVGHGPLARHAPPIDHNFVVRLHRADPLVGTRTDAVCAAHTKYQQEGAEFWHIDDDVRLWCTRLLSPFAPRIAKPSTGLSACMIARDMYPDEEIGVVGFDFTMNPELSRRKGWRHDAFAENRCIRTLGVKDLTPHG